MDNTFGQSGINRAQVRKTLVEKVKAAGIVGAGGAGFPTHVKINSLVDLVIANGTECEPLLSSDRLLMEQRAKDVVIGLAAVMVASGAQKGIIAIKDYYQRAGEALNQAICGHPQLSILKLGNYYPAGDEQILVYEACQKIVPEGGIPLDVGVLVQNVTTLSQVADALKDKPVTHKLVTVHGEVEKPAIINTPLGTPFSHLISLCGGSKKENWTALNGGPVMGQIAGQDGREDYVSKTTSGVIVLPEEHHAVKIKRLSPVDQLKRARSSCDGCRLCTDLCPRFLLGHRIEPHTVMRAMAYERDDHDQAILASFLCCFCGVCEFYACPCGLSPRALFQHLRQSLSDHKINNPLRQAPRDVHPVKEPRKVDAANMTRRVGVKKYDQKLATIEHPMVAPQLGIKLKQHLGAPALPLVKPGQRVQAGQLIAQIAKGQLGANIHAPLDGSVERVEQAVIFIKPGP